MMLMRAREEIRGHIQHIADIEALDINHHVNRAVAHIHAAHISMRIHGAETLFKRLRLFLIDEVRLADKDAVSETDLRLGFRLLI